MSGRSKPPPRSTANNDRPPLHHTENSFQAPNSPIDLKKSDRFPELMDPLVAEAIIKQEALQKELAKVRQSLNVKRVKRDQEMKMESEVAAKFEKIESYLRDLMVQRKDIQTDLAAIPLAPFRKDDDTKIIAEQVRIMKLRRAPLREDARYVAQQLKEVRKQISDMKAVAARLEQRLVDTSLSDIERTERMLDKQIAETLKDYRNAPVDVIQLQQSKEQLLKTKARVQGYWNMVDQLFEATTKEKNLEKAAQEIETKLNDIEADIKKIQDGNKQPKEETKGYDEMERKVKQELNQKLRDLNAKIEEQLQLKKEVLSQAGYPPRDGLKEELAKRDALVEEIQKLKQLIPEAVVEYDTDLHTDLIGPQGKTIRCMQEEFQVYINVIRSEGKVVIRGEQSMVEACADAVKQLMANAREQSVKETLTFNPTLYRELVGRGGHNLDEMRLKSGARIAVREAGEIEINGNQEAVDMAKEMMLHFLDNIYTCELPYDSDMIDVIYGRQGKTIRAVQAEMGVRISVQKDSNVVQFKGKTQQCELAKERYMEMLEDYKGPGEEMSVPQDLLAVIYGRGGRTIDKIEEETGAMIMKEGSSQEEMESEMATLRIRGPEECIQAARAALEALLAEREKTSVEVHCDAPMLPYLFRRPPGDPNAVCLLEQLRQSTGCDVVSADRTKCTIRISGKRDAVEECALELQELLQELEDEPPELSRNNRNITTVPFPPSLLRFLTRPPANDKEALCPLEQLRQDTGCTRVSANRNDSVVEISGPPEAQQECEARLKELLAEQEHQESLPEVSVEAATVPFSPSLLSFLIRMNKGAPCLLEQLRQDTGCARVSADRRANNVEITGPKAAVEDCSARLKELLAAEEKRQQPPPRRSPSEVISVPFPPPLLPFLIRPPADGTGGLCPLEQLRQATGCSRVSADRRTNRVEIIGPMEAAEECAERLKKLLMDQEAPEEAPESPEAPAVVWQSVPFPPVLFIELTRRGNQSRQSILEIIRKDHGCESGTIDRRESTATFSGSKLRCDEAAATLRKYVAEKQKLIHTFNLPNANTIGAVIGPQGSTINNIAKESGCELHVDRAQVCVDLFGSETAVAKAKDMLIAVLERPSRPPANRGTDI